MEKIFKNRLTKGRESHIISLLSETATKCDSVAQLDRAFGYEPKGRGFESPRGHHLETENPRRFEDLRGFFLGALASINPQFNWGSVKKTLVKDRAKPPVVRYR